MKKTLCFILIILIITGINIGCTNDPTDSAEGTKEATKDEYLLNSEREDTLERLSSMEPDEPDRTISDIPLIEFKSTDTGIGSAAGIWAREDSVVVSDQKNHKLIVLDWEGNVLEEVGKLGMGDLEFSSPGDIFWSEKEEMLYVLDMGNERIQKLSYDLTYIDEIHLKDLGLYVNDAYQSIVTDDKGNVYVSLNICDPVQLKIYCITPEGTIKQSEEIFSGILSEKDGDIYAVETMITIINENEGIDKDDITIINGQTSLYKMDGIDMKKVVDFPNMYTPSDLLWIEDNIYMASTLWNLIESFKIENDQLIYLETISPKIPFQDNNGSYDFTLSYYGDSIFAADLASGNIYKFDL